MFSLGLRHVFVSGDTNQQTMNNSFDRSFSEIRSGMYSDICFGTSGITVETCSTQDGLGPGPCVTYSAHMLSIGTRSY